MNHLNSIKTMAENCDKEIVLFSFYERNIKVILKFSLFYQ